MEDLGIMLLFVLPVAIIIGLYKLLHMSGPVGDIMRISWNIVCEIMSIIPGFGFMTNFLVTENEEKKQELVAQGEKNDADYFAREQEKLEQEKLKQQEEEERRRNVSVVRETYDERGVLTGRENLRVNSDGSMYYDSSEGKWKSVN